jgi:hypothetical protein
MDFRYLFQDFLKTKLDLVKFCTNEETARFHYCL